MPLGTVLKLSTLDETAFAGIDPKQVGVRLSLSPSLALKSKPVRLVLTLDYPRRDYPRRDYPRQDEPRQDDQKRDSEKFDYQLSLVRQYKKQSTLGWFSNGWFSKSLAKNVYQYQLNPISRLEFSRLQKGFLSKGRPSYYHWTVYYYLEDKFATPKAMNIDVELQLSAEDGFFYLLKDAPIEINSND